MIDRLFHFFRKHLHIHTEPALAVLKDTLALLVISLPKSLFLLGTAWAAGLFQPIVTAFLLCGLIRSFSRGIHARSGLVCFAVGVTLYFGVPYISVRLMIPWIVYYPLFLCCIVVFYFFSPQPTAARPVGRRQFFVFHKISMLIVMSYFAASFYVSESIRNIMLFILLFQSVCILPVTFQLSGQPCGVKGGGIVENR